MPPNTESLLRRWPTGGFVWIEATPSEEDPVLSCLSHQAELEGLPDTNTIQTPKHAAALCAQSVLTGDVMDLLWHPNNTIWQHLKPWQRQEAAPRNRQWTLACETSLITPVAQSVPLFPFSVPITVIDSDEFWFWHIGFHAALSPHAVTARRLVWDRAGEITTQHMGLYDRTVSIQNTFTLMESMPHQVGCGRQHLKAINGQASTESLMTTCWK